WETNILEQRIYSTHSAGQTFFEKLDLLLYNKDPVRVELAIIYLNALGLGFRGKYRHFDDQGALSSYRIRLFTFINRREPYLFRQKVHLFPDAYAHALEGAEAKELPNLRNWYLIFTGIGFAYLLASYIIWYFATADINQIVNRIISYNVTKESKINDK
ncbi:MAG: DotU family type IV/VI secretion system protein, partial [Alphaproteobacteria bacterium]|nr:DotU family type IV/VI secretion system protein [Alphaproteobacteria bacterium]